MDLDTGVRLVTFAAALILAMVIVKVALQRYRRRGRLDRPEGEASPLALLSYALLVGYVAAAQTGADFGADLTWKTVLGQVGVLVGAYVGVTQVFTWRRRKDGRKRLGV